MRKVTEYLKRPLSEYYVLLQATVLLVIAHLCIRYTSLKRYRSLIQRLAQCRPRSAARGDARRLGYLVERLGSRLGMNCYPKGITAYILLRRRCHQADLLIGVRKCNDGTLAGHAWVCAAGGVVVGKLPDLPTYAVMMRYPGESTDAPSREGVPTVE